MLFLLLVTFCAYIGTTKADTTDYWHVYYNKVRIGDYNGPGKKEIVLKRNAIKAGDSIALKYFRDTPCSDCITNLAVEDGKHHVRKRYSGKGTFSPVSFAVTDLLKTGDAYFEVYYFDDTMKSRTGKVLVFRIRLE
jgi:hypothetical protein